MSDLLAVFGESDSEAALLAEISRLHPTRVTVLIDEAGGDWALDETAAGAGLRDRLARLMAAIEHTTGATVTGLAGSRSQLEGWRFDREISGHPARTPVAA